MPTFIRFHAMFAKVHLPTARREAVQNARTPLAGGRWRAADSWARLHSPPSAAACNDRAHDHLLPQPPELPNRFTCWPCLARNSKDVCF